MVIDEEVEDSEVDNVIHPIGIQGRNRGIEVDVILEGELAKGQ